MKTRQALVIVCLLAVLPAIATAPAPSHPYPSGLKETLKTGDDLYQTLSPKFQQKVAAKPIAVQTLDTPVIAPIENSEEKKVEYQVSVSAGFIDLINHLAHAKAIDRMQKGYFDRYLENLGRQSATGGPVQPPDMIDPRFWTDSVMNDQISYFNQMMGMIVAINLSHHYLGHFSKYEKELAAGKLAPINEFLSPDEWQAAVKAGAINSFDCACTSDGIKALLDGIDKMPRRPEWTLYIVPQGADLKKLAKEFGHYEQLYFHGQLH